MQVNCYTNDFVITYDDCNKNNIAIIQNRINIFTDVER